MLLSEDAVLNFLVREDLGRIFWCRSPRFKSSKTTSLFKTSLGQDQKTQRASSNSKFVYNKAELLLCLLNQGCLIQGADGEPVLLCTLTRAGTKPLLDVHGSPEGSLHYQKSSTTKRVLQKLHKYWLLFTWMASLSKSLGMKAALKYMTGRARCFLLLFIFILCRGAY